MTLQRALVTRKKELTDLTSRAQELRHDDTLAEKLAWSLLRNRRLLRYKFRRQVPLGSVIADFYCPSLKLVIELDGSGHAFKSQASRDQRRDQEFERCGYRVLRFPNGIVLKAPAEFLKKVSECIAALEQARLNELHW